MHRNIIAFSKYLQCKEGWTCRLIHSVLCHCTCMLWLLVKEKLSQQNY